MFAQIFFTLQERPGERGVFTRGLPAWRGTSQRLGVHPSVRHANQSLRTRPNKTLPFAIRDRERVTPRKMLPQMIEHTEGMKFLGRRQAARPGEHNFPVVAARNFMQRLRNVALIISADFLDQLRCGRTVFLPGLTIIERAEFMVRLPHFRRDQLNGSFRRNEQICHRHRAVAHPRDLPARNEKSQRRKRGISRFIRIKGTREKKVRPSERFIQRPDGNRIGQHLRDKITSRHKPVGSVRREFQHRFRTCDRETLRRTFRIKMQFIRLEDGFKHRERIEMLDCQADANQLRPTRRFRHRRALPQKRRE